MIICSQCKKKDELSDPSNEGPMGTLIFGNGRDGVIVIYCNRCKNRESISVVNSKGN